MRADDFIEFAGRVAGLGAAGARSAVSRAYYGALHLAAALLEELGVPLPAGRTHGIVPILLQNSGDDDARIAGRLLSDLHSDRIKADYRLKNVDVETLRFAMLCVERAHEIRALLDAFRVHCEVADTRRQVQAALQARAEAMTGRSRPSQS